MSLYHDMVENSTGVFRKAYNSFKYNRLVREKASIIKNIADYVGGDSSFHNEIVWEYLEIAFAADADISCDALDAIGAANKKCVRGI